MNNDVFAPEIGDAELLAYLDGAADADVAAKIEGSEVHLKRAKELARMNNRLTAKLYRYTCPDSLELGEYHLGMLMQEQVQAIEAHLAECPHCARELTQLSEYMAAERTETAPGLPEQMKFLVARLVSDLTSDLTPGALVGAPAFAVRGDDGETLFYEADRLQISIDLHDDSDHPGRKILLGLITGTNAEGWEVSITTGGERVATAKVDDLGNFEFSGLLTGEYEIIIAGNGVEVHILTIEV